MINWSTADTPVGPFTAVVDDDGAVLASGWTAQLDELTALISDRLLTEQPRRSADLGPVSRAVRDYHDGDLRAADAVEVRQNSGEFLETTWRALREVPAGRRVSYAELAALAGRPKAVRAAAGACARNAAALFVPCHRVLRSDGSLGGFRYGTQLKQHLLDHERS